MLKPLSAKAKKLYDDLSDKIEFDVMWSELKELSDARCSGGYDTDGSLVVDVFEKGIELGKKAGDKPVYYIESHEDSEFLMFIGEEDLIEVLKKLHEAADEK